MFFDSLRSLRTRMLIPIICVVVTSTVVVATASRTIGRQIAMQEMRGRLQGIEKTLGDLSFPLNPTVLTYLSRLTDTHWVTVAESGKLIDSTLPVQDLESLIRSTAGASDASAAPLVQIEQDGDQREFFSFRVRRRGDAGGQREPEIVIALFDKSRVDDRARNAALFPLITGVSTIAVVSLVMLAITSRIASRLQRLENQVERIAEGDFETRDAEDAADEIGRLSKRIGRLGGQLDQLWSEVKRNHSTKLLHQISAGMAHQLRNTMTGARLSLQLYRDRVQVDDQDEIRVALTQLGIAEDYIKRLLTVGRSPSEKPEPRPLADCLEEVRSINEPIAKHLDVALRWNIPDTLTGLIVADGGVYSAALSNLVLNALDAGDDVSVEIEIIGERCISRVCDDGPGVAPEIRETIFEPFVTSKPEGVGLGLPVVAQAAESLGGQVDFHRRDDRTVFELSAPIQILDDPPATSPPTGPNGPQQ